MPGRKILSFIVALGLVVGAAHTVRGDETSDPEETAIGRTPPRLSFVDGQASFWRPGAQDWVQAQVNTPLSPGDQLSTGSPGNLEVQIGARAFVRGWANTQVGLENQEPDYLQFKVAAGHVAFDLRTLDPGYTVEVDTPNAAFTIEHPGYYRVEVMGERTSFITRRAGRATLIPASGEAVVIAPSEEVVIEGTESARIASFAAPKRDDWDKWNYARTDALLDSVSARYVSPGTYGVDDLDHNGTWRVVDTYGPVWVPTAVPSGWAPYSAGAWTMDPFYGWSWVDTAPWGWAPYHYGRWVYVNGFWGWAPGPIVVRPVYAPALVAFFGGPGVRIGVGGPVVGWVPLGWGEPLVPWWGRPGFIHRPWWGGWGGPRVVNNVVVTRTTVVNVQSITLYRNASVPHAVVVVNENRFGRGHITSARLTQVDVKGLQPIHTAPQVTTTPASFVPTANRGIRPSEEVLRRPVVATRQPHRWEDSTSGGERRLGPAGVPMPAPRIVSVPQQREPASVVPRPPFGQSKVERPTADRPQMPPRQKQEGRRSSEDSVPLKRQAPTPLQPEPKAAGPSSTAPQPLNRRPEMPPSPIGQGQPSAPPRREDPGRPDRGSGGAPVTTRETPPQLRHEPQVTSPSPAAPQPTAQRIVAPPPVASRPETARPPAHPLPGEPASRLAPNRTERRPPQEVGRREAPPQGRPQGAPGSTQRDRSGG